METYQQQQQQMNREKGIEERQENKQDQPIITSSTSPPQNSQASNSSSLSSSPSHEFTFTISIHNSTYNSSISKFTNNDEEKSKVAPNNSSSNNNNPLAVDLSPADEIFFHGHLLPLHLLSHLPKSPSGSSSNSMDSFTLPIRELLEDFETHKESESCSTSNRSNITIDNSNKNRGNRENRENREGSNNNTERKREGKSNNFAFSLFGFKKVPKGSKVRDREEKENHHNKKKKVRFDVIHALKKYLKMVKPMVFFKGKRDKFRINGKSSYSYSGNVTPRNNYSNNNNNDCNKKKEFIRGWRGEYYSAPASMRTSPTNSGVLVATNNAVMIPPASDSTMEELQAAIQAAIVHCKNSFAKEEKLKC